MLVDDLEMLEYLHDAVVENLSFSFANDGERTVQLRVRAHADCGYAPWNGMTVTVRLRDTVLFVGTLLGYTTSGDTISMFQQGVSSEAERKVADLRGHGLGVPHIKLGLAFSSGSEIDVVCRAVDVEVEAPSPRHGSVLT